MRRIVTQHWIIGDAIYDYPLEKVMIALIRETDPYTRANLEQLAGAIAERRLAASEPS